MKKFAALIGSVLMLVVMCLQPLTVLADNVYFLPTGREGSLPYPNSVMTVSEYLVNNTYLNDKPKVVDGIVDRPNYLYFTFNGDVTDKCSGTFFIIFNDNAVYSFDNSSFTITSNNSNDIVLYMSQTYNANRDKPGITFSSYITEFSFIPSSSTGYFIDSNNTTFGLSDKSRYLNNNNNIIIYDTELNFNPDPNSLNVEVIFNPVLVGQVDRSVTTSDGNTAFKQSLFMNVINHSSFPIQYDMVIMKKNIVSVRGGNAFESTLDSDDPSLLSQYTLQYDDDPAFIYYSDDWVYTHGMDSDLQYWDNNTYKYNKATRWHYLAANSSVVQQFDFSQIHLVEGEEYVVTVRAIRNDYGIASEKIVYLASSDPAYPELKQIQGDDIETVYTSDFSMLQYNDVVYDPNNSMNGVKPYDGQNGIVDKQRYSWSRNASEDSDGNIDYTSVNHLDNSNSWVNRQYGGVVTNHKKLVSGTQSFGGLNTIISPVVMFVSTTFGFLPLPLQSSFYLGFFAIVVIAVIKKVFA